MNVSDHTCGLFINERFQVYRLKMWCCNKGHLLQFLDVEVLGLYAYEDGFLELQVRGRYTLCTFSLLYRL
jgi:hypothetical protein